MILKKKKNMPKSLYCPNQIVLSNQGKENWDRIRWDWDTLNKKAIIHLRWPNGIPKRIVKDKRFVIL